MLVISFVLSASFHSNCASSSPSSCETSRLPLAWSDFAVTVEPFNQAELYLNLAGPPRYLAPSPTLSASVFTDRCSLGRSIDISTVSSPPLCYKLEITSSCLFLERYLMQQVPALTFVCHNSVVAYKGETLFPSQALHADVISQLLRCPGLLRSSLTYFPLIPPQLS